MTAYDLLQLAGLVLFTLMVSARVATLWRTTGRLPVRLGRRSTGRGLTAATVALMTLWILETLRHVLVPTWRPLPAVAYAHMWTPPPRLPGAALTVAALAGMATALWQLGGAWRLGIDDQRPERLVTDGVYALSRHPIYVCFDAYLAGSFFMNGTLPFLACMVAMAAMLHFQMLHEERYLAAAFGKAYAGYTARTARYISWRVQPSTRVAPERADSDLL